MVGVATQRNHTVTAHPHRAYTHVWLWSTLWIGRFIEHLRFVDLFKHDVPALIFLLAGGATMRGFSSNRLDEPLYFCSRRSRLDPH